MAFYGTRFIYDGVGSENYSLTISSSEGGEEQTPFPGDVKIYSEKLIRRTDEFFYSTSIEPMLEFPVTFMTDNGELSAHDLELIGKWLFGRKTYAKLKILQYDMADVYFDCIFTQPKIHRVGNIIRGVSAIVHNKNPWAVTEPKEFTYSFTPPAVNINISHQNLSDYVGYTWPKLVITMAVAGGNMSIRNNTDASRLFSFTGLSSGEVLTVDNSLQIITSSTSLLRMSKFNKKFFRLRPGINSLTINGQVSQIVMSYPLARKIGG